MQTTQKQTLFGLEVTINSEYKEVATDNGEVRLEYVPNYITMSATNYEVGKNKEVFYQLHSVDGVNFELTCDGDFQEVLHLKQSGKNPLAQLLLMAQLQYDRYYNTKNDL